MLDVVRLANYVAGLDSGPIAVARVIPEMAVELCVRLGTPIWLSDYTMTKTTFRHPEINFQDYLKLPAILSDGFIVKGRRSRSIEVYHVEPCGTEVHSWRVAVKATVHDEVFVKMFHRYNLADARRMRRRAEKSKTLLRECRDEKARLLLSRARSS